ncbi:MAG: DNA-directed RNA polymerase subunit omega [Methylobacter sp.]|nr:DNA-directed RNA polymerase subunit omega [Methylococcales bacterium]MDD5113177.1 DNA-directed RNA polymerase subunit omega [Methylobacter sp.]
MARVTIEDCLDNVENRFKLVLLASERARQLQHGATEFLPRGKDKDTVLALREIAAGHVTPDNIALLHRIPDNQPRDRDQEQLHLQLTTF